MRKPKTSTKMLTLKYSTLLILLSLVIVIKSQSTLEIEIVNLESNKGKVALELLDKNNNSIIGKKEKIENNKSVIIFKDLKNDQYAIRCFHDENSNDEMDTNWLGIPTEGFGFSNDAFGNFGPKDFEEWLFEVSGDTKIKITTKNF